ncbi:serine hydrolase domain-containing protein [Pseudoalteromonas sp. MMG022]|uniref:serine hydrolase domain-containing protein n=1 Tax=Pseudoalteromonas sp. MMG022 TaxID=2909978 RepID=UPI001F35DF79|nr:serine hydrolase domain-containing protein [Pseudoalteromonas sp. MMG022]MCF6436762.1 beta-lactamase family protein [Pseudoalteromonas sp. MMG022]
MKNTAFLLSLLLAFNVQAASSSLTAKIDGIMKEAIGSDAPGCNLGVSHNGQFIHKAGYGMANLELDVPLDGNQVHRMASVSKQFTAMAVLILVQQGKIDLDKDIHAYLPELRDYKAKVTIRQMLDHTSGMGDYDLIAPSFEGEKSERAITLKSAAGGEFRLGNQDYLTISEFYDVVKTVPLARAPNTQFQYSNLAYFLLSVLVEEVSGKSLRQFSDEHIFKPLGMKHTFFSDNPLEVVKNRASGYKLNDEGRYVIDMTNLFWVGDGGLHTNLDDMLIWNNQFYQPKVGGDPDALIKMMNTPNAQIQPNAEEGYANGQFVSQFKGYTKYAHSGGWLGTLTYFARYPQLKLSLSMMCNDVSNGAVFDALNEVTTIVIDNITSEQTP